MCICKYTECNDCKYSASKHVNPGGSLLYQKELIPFDLFHEQGVIHLLIPKQSIQTNEDRHILIF